MFKQSDIRSGTEISCEIENCPCKKAKIQIENDYVYVCQNKKAGSPCDNKLGFYFSWSVGPLSFLESQNISDFFKGTGITKVTLSVCPRWDTKENER